MGIEEFFDNNENTVLIDVRTPAEYKKGHIPGAVNIPLFSDEERVVVGTAYKKRSPEAALLIGLDYVGPKMSQIIREAKKCSQGKEIVVHCWRGGKRSGSVAWLLGMAGLKVNTLQGGYKAYRTWVQENLNNLPHQLIVLSGHTGSRKTELLIEMKKKGQQMIDLEGLANHKGSAFGALGQEPQPSIEQFENMLWAAFMNLNPELPTWVEGESKSIGGVFLIDGFWDKLCTAAEIEINVPDSIRIAHLLSAYGNFPIEDLKSAFDRIHKRLGGQHHKSAIEALDVGNITLAASISLQYYDKAYDYSRTKSDREIRLQLELPESSLSEATDNLLTFAKQNLY